LGVEPSVIPEALCGLPERYRVERLLGEGGFGRVYLATDRHLRRECAIKVASQPEGHERLEREARIAASLGSSHVVRVFDVAHLENGSPYLVMEYLRGESLASYLAREGSLPPKLVVEWALQICSGLGEAHALGLIHRDLKPSNIFLVEEPHRAPLVKLLDFGLARASTSTASSAFVTTSGVMIGSPAFMSPEQIRDATLAAPTDIWSLGVVMYRMLTGHLPFTGSSNGALLAAITADPHDPIENHLPTLNPDLVRIVDRCLAKATNLRFQSAVELSEALRRVDVGASRPPRPPPAVLPASSEPTEDITAIAGDAVPASNPSRRRAIVVGATLGAALVGAVLVFGAHLQSAQEGTGLQSASASSPPKPVNERPRTIDPSSPSDATEPTGARALPGSPAKFEAQPNSAAAEQDPRPSSPAPATRTPKARKKAQPAEAPSKPSPEPVPAHATPRIIEEPQY
jgi:serine/threonine-protein kinase